uniref:Tat pathway signal sequence domain protein n=1 Tax=Rhodopseudomonas palustris (strain BisA53) TaxID=316055 RepID=Q07KX2_RHOP5
MMMVRGLGLRRQISAAAALGGAALAGALATAAMAQTPAPAPVPSPAPATVERSAKGASAKNIRVGVYLNVQPDCSSGALPAIRLVNPPSNGTVSIKRGKVTATNYKRCLALEVPGFIAFYQSKPDFAGTDVVTLEIKYPEGRTELQRITINVGSSGAPGAAGQKI